MIDHCTAFPDTVGSVYIGDCCKEHDKTCSTLDFYRCLKSKITPLMTLIVTVGGAIGCIVKYRRF